MKLSPYLFFYGNASEALEYYQKIFAGEVVSITYFKDMQGMEVKEEEKDKIMHAELRFGGNIIHMSDDMRSDSTKVGSQINLHFDFDNEADINRIYDALKIDGRIYQPLESAPWGAKYACVIDPFNMTWSLNYTVQNS